MSESFVEIIDVINLGTFISNYRWRISFPIIGKALTDQGADVFLKNLNMKAESVTLPKVTTPAVEVVIRGHKVKQAGIADYGNTLTITSFENKDMEVFRLIDVFRDAIWSYKTGNHGVQQDKSDYTCTMVIERLDNTNTEVLQKYVVYNCWMEDNDVGGDLDASTADPTKPTITFSFDFFQAEHGGIDLTQ